MEFVHRFPVGSHAWQINVEGSDEDYMSLVLHPAEAYYGLGSGPKPVSQHIFGGKDVVTVDFRHYLQQLAKGNPNMVSILFSKQFEAGDMPNLMMAVWSLRMKFVTQAWVRAELGMAWRYWCDSNEEGGTLKDVVNAFLRLEILENVLDYGEIVNYHAFKVFKDVRMGFCPRSHLGNYETFSQRVKVIKEKAAALPEDGFDAANELWNSVFKGMMK